MVALAIGINSATAQAQIGKNRAILDKVKTGDRVNFTLSIEGGEFLITGVEVYSRK